MFWQAVVLPILVVAVVVAVIAFLGRLKPRWAFFLSFIAPPAALIVFIYVYSQPAVVKALNLDQQVLPQVFAASVGAIVGILGAGVIAYIQNEWAESARKDELDWRFLISLNEKVTEYHIEGPNATERATLEGILQQAEALAKLAEQAGAIKPNSCLADFVEEQKSRLSSSWPSSPSK